MIDVENSIKNLAWTVEHHYQHILNQHEFMRRIAVQFELSYTDFRVIQLALQLSGEKNHQLLADFSSAYEQVYKYESVFSMDGLEAFNEEYGNEIDEYRIQKDNVLRYLEEIKKLS